MKLIISLVFVLAVFLAGCGTVTEEGILFKTADPKVSIGFRFPTATPVVDAPALPTVTPSVAPEVVPAEEVGEVVPDPTPAPPCEIIKGNISRTGEKIYHVPGGANYEQVKIDEAAGELFFCTEEEAVAAGWRKALR